MTNKPLFCFYRGDLTKYSLMNKFKEYLKSKDYPVTEIEHIKREKDLIKENNVFVCGCVGEGAVKERYAIYKFFRDHGKPVVVFDRNFFIPDDGNKDVYSSFRIQINSLYEDQAIQLFDRFVENRWEKIKNRCKIELKPWRKKGDHIMVFLNNTRGNMNNERNLYHFINSTLENIRKHSNRKILIFSHIKEKVPKDEIEKKLNLKNLKDCQFFYREDFRKYLENCWCFVTRNSSSSLQAVIAGIPIFLDKNSRVFTESLANFNTENTESPLMPKREPVLNALAHRIWYNDEVSVVSEQILKVLNDKYFK